MGSCQKSSCSGVWWWPLSAPALLHTQSRFPLELEWAQDSSAVLSPQDISVCTFSYPWGIKGGALLYFCSTCRNCSGSTVSPWWGHRAFLGAFLVGSRPALICGLCGFLLFPILLRISEFPLPMAGGAGAEPALPLRPLFFECSCSQRRHPKPHPSQSCWAWILSSMF